MKPKYVRVPAPKTFSLEEIRHGVWWDSFELNDRLSYSTRLFRNANVGMTNLSNMQVGGQLVFPDGFSAIIQRWFARTNVVGDAERASITAWSGNTVATLFLRQQVTWQLHLSELLARRPCHDPDRPEPRRMHDPWPCVVHSRDAMSVSVDMFDGSRDRIVERFIDRWPGQAPAIVSVVFEGLVIPSEIVDPVLSILMTLRDRRVAAHVEIVDYILGVSRDLIDSREKDILRVVADGILQHKAML